MIPGALQCQVAQRRGEGLRPPAARAGRAATGAGDAGALVIGVIGIEFPGDDPPHDLQGDTPDLDLEGLEVLKTTRTDQTRDLGLGFLRERFIDVPPFSPPCASASRPRCNRAAARASLASRNSSDISRKRPYSPTC